MNTDTKSQKLIDNNKVLEKENVELRTKLERAQRYAHYFIKAKNGQVLIPEMYDLEVLNDCLEVFLRRRITNKSNDIMIAPSNRPRYQSMVTVTNGNGTYYIYSQVSDYKIREQLGIVR